MADDAHRGAKIGPRIANLVTRSIIATHNGLLHTKHKLGVMLFNTITNEISDEVDQTLGPIIRQLAQDYDKDGPAAAYLNFMGYGRGQLKAIAGSAATGQSLTWALGTIISNIFAPDVYDAVGFTPNMLPDSASAGQMAAVGILSDSQARDIINRNGFANIYGDGWIEIAKQYPDVTALIEMMRRGLINGGTFEELARKSGVPQNLISLWGGMERNFVSMEDAAVSYMRGAIDRGQLNDIGAWYGYQSTDIDIYLQSIGEPPGTMEMLEAYRRGIVDKATLERGILQSRTRNEWIPVIEQLRYSPMSISDAVNAVVQGHMGEDAAARIADENGLEPGQFDTLVQTAGSPLSRTELEQLYNLGAIGSDVVEQGLRESRLKNKYVPDALLLHRRLLEPRTIGESVTDGAISHQEGIRKAMEHGFNAEDAAIMVDAAASRKVRVFKDRIIAAAESMYVDNAIDRESVMSIVQAMGYTETEADFAVQAAEFHREARVFTAATNAIRSKYVAHHITAQEASALLDSIGMQATQREYLLKMWAVEVAANTRVLTPAQVIKAAGSGMISADDALARLEFMGYSADDAALLLGGA